jgi:3D (Asp-Asp-Asp) domain-containing protein
MSLGARVRVGIALHVAVNVGFAGAAVAAVEPASIAGRLVTAPASVVAPAIASAPVAAAVTAPPTTPTTSQASERAAPAPSRGAPSGAGPRTVTSTAYCLDGTTASGSPVRTGIAAMNGVPLGTSVQVLDGPLAGTTLVVADRIGHGSELDVWFADCEAARSYGRRAVRVALGG